VYSKPFYSRAKARATASIGNYIVKPTLLAVARALARVL